MRWIVGIDLRERSHGAVHMAAWLRTRHAGTTPPEFIGIHVVDERLRDSAKVMSEVIAAGERALADAADHSGVDNPFSEVRVVFAPSVDEGLAQAATTVGVDGALIGRAAPSGGHGLVRLGSVARRLLRRLPAPVLVVPPNLAIDTVGGGAIVLATGLDETSTAAARMAAQLAREIDRGLVAIHLDPEVDFGRDLLGDRSILAAWTPRRTLADVDAWAQAHGLTPTRTGIAHEGVVEGLLAEAAREDAPIIACGSRRLTTADRIFTSSIGSDLARFADRPVLVVPSGD